jgi:hypothetical protein
MVNDIITSILLFAMAFLLQSLLFIISINVALQKLWSTSECTTICFEALDKLLYLGGICHECTFVCFGTSSPLSFAPNHIVSTDVCLRLPKKRSDLLCHYHLLS